MIPFLIGLAGHSGAGKSTLAEHLERQGGVKRFRFDAYYKDRDECPTLDGRPHWDLPDSLHLAEAAAALRDLKEGNDILLPVYSRREDRRTGTMLYKPAPVLFVEGLMLFSYAPIRELLDLRLWLEVPEEVALARRLARQPDYDVGYHHRVALPAARQFVVPYRESAHAVIDGTQTIAAVADETDRIIRKYLRV
jgi:uridine kinase